MVRHGFQRIIWGEPCQVRYLGLKILSGGSIPANICRHMSNSTKFASHQNFVGIQNIPGVGLSQQNSPRYFYPGEYLMEISTFVERGISGSLQSFFSFFFFSQLYFARCISQHLKKKKKFKRASSKLQL